MASSSGEAELYALVKASVEMLGLRNLAKEMGLELKGTLYTDSSAAKGAIHRLGMGCMKHVEGQHLWVQEMAAKATLKYKKVPRCEKLRRLAHQVLGDQHCRQDFREAWHDASDVVFLKSSVCCGSCLEFSETPTTQIASWPRESVGWNAGVNLLLVILFQLHRL